MNWRLTWLALQIFTVSPTLAQEVLSFCDTQRLEMVRNDQNELRYRSFGTYCEGYDAVYRSSRAEVALEIVSVTVGRVAFDPSSTRVLVAAAAPTDGPISLRFRSVLNFDAYRLDAQLPAAAALDWDPSKVFDRTPFRQEHLGVLGMIGVSIAPILVGTRSVPGPTDLFVVVKPHRSVQDVEFRWLVYASGQCVQTNSAFTPVPRGPQVASLVPVSFLARHPSRTSHCLEITARDGAGVPVPGTRVPILAPSQ